MSQNCYVTPLLVLSTFPSSKCNYQNYIDSFNLHGKVNGLDIHMLQLLRGASVAVWLHFCFLCAQPGFNPCWIQGTFRPWLFTCSDHLTVQRQFIIGQLKTYELTLGFTPGKGAFPCVRKFCRAAFPHAFPMQQTRFHMSGTYAVRYKSIARQLRLVNRTHGSSVKP